MWRLRHLLDGNLVCPAHRPEAIAERGEEGGRAVKHKVSGPGLDPDRLLDLRSHLNGGRLIRRSRTAVAQNSRQPKERLEGESDGTPHVLACAYRSLAHVQRSSRRLQSRMAGLVDTMGLIPPSVPAGANPKSVL